MHIAACSDARYFCIKKERGRALCPAGRVHPIVIGPACCPGNASCACCRQVRQADARHLGPRKAQVRGDPRLGQEACKRSLCIYQTVRHRYKEMQEAGLDADAIRRWLEDTPRRIPVEKDIERLLPCNWTALPDNNR